MKHKITQQKNNDGSVTYTVNVGRMSESDAKKAIEKFARSLQFVYPDNGMNKNFYIPFLSNEESDTVTGNRG